MVSIFYVSFLITEIQHQIYTVSVHEHLAARHKHHGGRAWHVKKGSLVLESQKAGRGRVSGRKSEGSYIVSKVRSS